MKQIGFDSKRRKSTWSAGKFLSCTLSLCVLAANTAAQTFAITVGGDGQGNAVTAGRAHLMKITHSDGGAYTGSPLVGWYTDVAGNGATAPQVCQPVDEGCASTGACSELLPAAEADAKNLPALSFNAGVAQFCLVMPDVGTFAIQMKDGSVKGEGPALRSRPSYFQLDSASVALTNRSDLVECTNSKFTYMSEPFRVTFKLKAMSKAGPAGASAVTSHYASDTFGGGNDKDRWTKSGTNSVGLWLMAVNHAVDTDTCTVKFSTADPWATSFVCSGGATPSEINHVTGPRVIVSSASMNWPAANDADAGVGTFTADVVLKRADTEDGPYESVLVGIAPQDGDNVATLLSDWNMDADEAAGPERVRLELGAPTIKMRYGRLRLSNAYGSELLPVPMDVQAQYWDRNKKRYANNTDDGCTNLKDVSFKADYAMGKPIKDPKPSVKGANVLTANTGKGIIRVAPPIFDAAHGKTALSVTTVSSAVPYSVLEYLPGAPGIATFGVYRSGPVIFRRELHY
jgi:hypothetical protein